MLQFLIPAAISAIGGAVQSNQAKKAAQGAAAASQVDIDALDAKTREIAKRNAFESAELERQLTPEVAELRTNATKGVLAGLGDTTMENAKGWLADYGQGQEGRVNVSAAQSPLLRAAIAKVKSELEMGGRLDQATANEAMRGSLARSGAVGGGLGIARDLTARDLGLTSMALQQQRLQNAMTAGSAEQGLEQGATDTQFRNVAANQDIASFNATNILNKINLLKALSDSDYARNLSAAQFGQSIQQPVVGLDPGSVADVVAGNATNRSAALSNQANTAGAQSQGLFSLAGQLGGMGLLNYGKSTSAPGTSTVPSYLQRTGTPYGTSLPTFGK